MYRKKLSALAVVTGLAVVLLVSPASAWEFTMQGSFGWELEFLGQTGHSGFFGPYDIDAGSGAAGTVVGQFAPYNLWGGQPHYRMASGSDTSWQTQYMSTNMELRMNKALRVRGLYYIGEWTPSPVRSPEGFEQDARGNLPASEYLNNRFPGIQQSFSPGYWNTLWLTAQLPWGELSIGKRASTFGMGLGWNGTFTRSSESFSLFAPYGPFRFGLSFYPSRRIFTNGSYYHQDYDKNNARMYDAAFTMTYRCGPIDFGFLANVIQGHNGGEGRITSPAARITDSYRDRDDFYGSIYLKYYTGVVFFNAEVNWYDRTDRNRRKDAAGAPALNVRDTYIEHWRWAAEMSVLSGPLKVGFLYAWLSGGDRRGWGSNTGVSAVRQIDRNGILRSDSFANTGLFRPYSYLQVYSYGLGNFVDTTTTYGYAEDASVYGARLDYSIAANLNVYGTFFWADRASKSGFGWGAISPDPNAANGEVLFGPSAPNSGAGPVGAPNIPDTNLGWEVDVGMDWKLLEGLNVLTTLAYWQPGNWYKFACIDKAVPNWGAPSAANNWGINPDRAIDPIWGLRIIISGDF